MPTSAYIHIPFCKSKCKYCSFVSFNKTELMSDYVSALLREIKAKYKGEKLKTLYFGGGTPSLLRVEFLKEIINQFNLEKGAEVTLELNPDDADIIPFLPSVGINRLSIGSQTFNDEVLKLIGRRHNSADIINAVNRAKKSGFKNISLDLIYGLPLGNNEAHAAPSLKGEGWGEGSISNIIKQDLTQLLNLDIQHISTYGLKIEEDSFWGNHPQTLQFPTDDEQAEMYEVINEVLETNGFYRYEVSNFAKQGFESRHNLNYWNNAEYYGFGVAAHGYIDGIRYSNLFTLEKYLKNPLEPNEAHQLSTQEKLEEEIFLGFRKTEGINILDINQKFGIDFEKEYGNLLEKYSDYFIKTQNGYALNLKGTLMSNIILSEFLEF